MRTKAVSVPLRCNQCNAIPYKRKHKPRRLWRKKGYTKYFCGCGHRWNVYLSTAAN